MGSSDTIRQMEKELMALRQKAAKAVDTTETDRLRAQVESANAEVDKLKDLATSLSKENKSLKAKNTRLSKKLVDLESSLKVVDAAVDKALDDE